jgi:hypothetical protein
MHPMEPLDSLEPLAPDVARQAASWMEPMFLNRTPLKIGELPFPLVVDGPDPEDDPDEAFTHPASVPAGARFQNAPGEGEYLDQVIERGDPEWSLDGYLIVPYGNGTLRYRAELHFAFEDDLYVPKRLQVMAALPLADEAGARQDPSLRYEALFPAD